MHSIIDPQTKIYSKEYYLHRLAEEKLRAERSHTPLSLLIIDIPYCKKERNNGQLINKLIKKLHLIMRKTDIKSWYEKDKIAILMPDTPKQGALKLTEKVSEEIKKITNGKDPQEGNISLMVYTYGENSSSSPSHFHSLSVDSKKNTQAKYDFIHTNWKPVSQGDIAVLSDSYFFDMLADSIVSTSISFQKGIKRSIDIIGSLIGIIITAPLLLIISALIKLTSPGPVFFKQERLGYRGEKFTFIKFRSMNSNTDADLHRNHVVNLITESSSTHKSWSKLENDPRITKIGKFLRKGSMDELPQLFNVLKGEMSLVGPRPPIPYEVEKYKLWHLKRIMEVTPGITGLWQTRGRGETTFNDMVRLDLAYINNWSLWLDFKIILKTFLVVLSTKGAE